MADKRSQMRGGGSKPQPKRTSTAQNRIALRRRPAAPAAKKASKPKSTYRKAVEKAASVALTGLEGPLIGHRVANAQRKAIAKIFQKTK